MHISKKVSDIPKNMGTDQQRHFGPLPTKRKQEEAANEFGSKRNAVYIMYQQNGQFKKSMHEWKVKVQKLDIAVMVNLRHHRIGFPPATLGYWTRHTTPMNFNKNND